jgi:formylmethanofuran dehydrogenase subunit E
MGVAVGNPGLTNERTDVRQRSVDERVFVNVEMTNGCSTNACSIP